MSQWNETSYSTVPTPSPMAQMIKNLPAMREAWFQSLGWEDPWRRAWQPTPVFLSGESPWTEEPGGLQSMGSQRVGHNWAAKHSTGIFPLPSITLMFACYNVFIVVAWKFFSDNSKIFAFFVVACVDCVFPCKLWYSRFQICQVVLVLYSDI